MCVGILSLSLSTIVLFYFGTVMIEWYFLSFVLLLQLEITFWGVILLFIVAQLTIYIHHVHVYIININVYSLIMHTQTHPMLFLNPLPWKVIFHAIYPELSVIRNIRNNIIIMDNVTMWLPVGFRIALYRKRNSNVKILLFPYMHG
jgi:hypothetical protein